MKKNVATNPSLCFLHSPSCFSSFLALRIIYCVFLIYNQWLLSSMFVCCYSAVWWMLKGSLTQNSALKAGHGCCFTSAVILKPSVFLRSLFIAGVVECLSPHSQPVLLCPFWELTCCILIPGHDWDLHSLKGVPAQMVISQHPLCFAQNQHQWLRSMSSRRQVKSAYRTL